MGSRRYAISDVDFRGAYDPAILYPTGSIVRYQGSMWRAWRLVQGVGPVEGADWTLLVEKGDTGDAGTTATGALKGIVELATAAEIQSGAVGPLVPSADELKAELDRRAGQKSLVGGIDNGPIVFQEITVGSTPILSADLRGSAAGKVPANALGVYATFYARAQSETSQVGISGADVIPGNSLRLIGQTGNANNIVAAVPLGTSGTNAGKIAVASLTAATTVGVYAWVNGWWT